jgi:hypothetical protein
LDIKKPEKKPREVEVGKLSNGTLFRYLQGK